MKLDQKMVFQRERERGRGGERERESKLNGNCDASQILFTR